MGVVPFSINKSKLLILLIVTGLIVLWWAKIIDFTCPIKEMTKFHCAMCRSTRAMQSFLDFNIIESFKLNPMALIWCYYISLAYIKLILEVFNSNALEDPLGYKYSYTKYAFMIMVVLNTIYLNIF